MSWQGGVRWVPRLEQLQEELDIGPNDFLPIDPNPKACVVVGASGGLGQHLVSFLAATGRLTDIVAVGRRPASEVSLPQDDPHPIWLR